MQYGEEGELSSEMVHHASASETTGIRPGYCFFIPSLILTPFSDPDPLPDPDLPQCINHLRYWRIWESRIGAVIPRCMHHTAFQHFRPVLRSHWQTIWTFFAAEPYSTPSECAIDCCNTTCNTYGLMAEQEENQCREHCPTSGSGFATSHPP